MFALLMMVASLGHAADWKGPTPYAVPRLNASYVSVNGVGTTQVAGGGEVGLKYRDRDKPHWLSVSRVSAVGIYGLTSGSLGADLRVGSFFGPNGKVVQLLSGPDIWYNGYGQPGAVDYFLSWSPGVDLRNTAVFKVAKGLRILGEATPGWAFVGARQSSDLVVFHEFRALAALRLNTEVISLTVGYQRTYNAVGMTEGLVLGAGF